ncbi:MAG: hypothetical protein COW54_13865 [Rhodobacteraceae bacterium CG17_big_fil_post_rev_8_21_14_2_50_63_15]|nr:MAG: hypothetical protein COW54_13865 [Rhodobacteraceae bacterium CG17_big_fil_post_rev_8_21_14_2_50_63_15]
MGLTRFTDLFVLGPETSFHFGPNLDIARRRDAHDIDFVMTGGTFMQDRRFRVEAVLIDTHSGQYLWADSIERTLDPETIMSVRDDVACSVTRAIAPGSTCMANLYTSNHDRLQTEDLSTAKFITLHVIDAVGLVHAMLLRLQVMIIPVRSLVLTGGH